MTNTIRIKLHSEHKPLRQFMSKRLTQPKCRTLRAWELDQPSLISKVLRTVLRQHETPLTQPIALVVEGHRRTQRYAHTLVLCQYIHHKI